MSKFQTQRILNIIWKKPYQISINLRPGPVWIDIPADIQNAQISEKKLITYKKKSIKKFFKRK